MQPRYPSPLLVVVVLRLAVWLRFEAESRSY
jgi:hypothetical protein